MALDNVSFMDPKRIVLKNQNCRDNPAPKDLRNFPPLNQKQYNIRTYNDAAKRGSHPIYPTVQRRKLRNF